MSGTLSSGRIPGGARQRATAFCERHGLRVPVLEAPMAGACPASLAIAVARGPAVPESTDVVTLPDFQAQLAAFLEASPPVVSSIMGLFPLDFVRELKARGIAWFACATAVAEALEAEAAGVPSTRVVPNAELSACSPCRRDLPTGSRCR